MLIEFIEDIRIVRDLLQYATEEYDVHPDKIKEAQAALARIEARGDKLMRLWEHVARVCNAAPISGFHILDTDAVRKLREAVSNASAKL